MDEYKCPACTRQAALKHFVTFASKKQLYYACKNDACRNRFQVLQMDGWNDQIVAQSPREVNRPKPNALASGGDMMVTRMGCPSCGRYGNVKMTVRRRDGYWRRHMCKTDGPYYTCETADGITIHRKIQSLAAVEL